MWCSTSNNTCLFSPNPNSHTRSGVSRSNSMPTDAASSSLSFNSDSAMLSTCSRNLVRASSPLSTFWYATPSSSGYTVRSASCRPTTSPSASSSALSSSSPSKRSPSGMLYVPLLPSIRYRNHNRCCPYDNGSRSGLACPTSTGRSALSSLSRSTNSATVGASNSVRMLSSFPSAALTRLTSRAASNECPPNSKKLSSLPTRSTPTTPANSAHNTSSSTVRGGV